MKLKDKNLYYVGGIVRDEILGIKNFDTDYCYEGNAIEFAQNLGLNIIKENPNFGTVRVLLNDEEIDIASTRTEVYPKVGHLPKVKNIGCSLYEDLKRRDFTINAMAKRTTDGEIVDILGGMNDIKNKTLRVLHEKSFIDDPTRILRSLKFSIRFGFEQDKITQKLQNDYLSNINYDMSYHRIKKELKETFNLNKQICYDRFVEEKLYKLLSANAVAPSFRPTFNNINLDEPWIIYMSFFDLSNLELTRKEKRILEWAERLKSEQRSNNTPSESVLINKIYQEANYG